MTTPSLDLRSVSVVVPVFNSAATLPELAARVEAALAGAASELELILVNDASGDASWSAIAELAEAHRWIVGVDLASNVGQLEATYCGARLARHAVTVTLDDDLQYRPEDIPALLAALGPDAGLAYGRPERARHAPLRRAGSAALRLALRALSGRRGMVRSSSFRAFDTALFQDADDGTAALVDAVLLGATDRIVSRPVGHEPRRSGSSGYGVRGLVRQASRIVTGLRGSRSVAGSDRYRVRRTLNAGDSPQPPNPDAGSRRR